MAGLEDRVPGLGDVVDDLTALRSDIAKLSETVAQLASVQAGTASTKVMDAVEGAKQSLTGTADVLWRSTREAASGAEGRIREASSEFEGAIERNPLTAVMVAAGLGLMFGMMGRRDGR